MKKSEGKPGKFDNVELEVGSPFDIQKSMQEASELQSSTSKMRKRRQKKLGKDDDAATGSKENDTNTNNVAASAFSNSSGTAAAPVAAVCKESSKKPKPVTTTNTAPSTPTATTTSGKTTATTSSAKPAGTVLAPSQSNPVLSTQSSQSALSSNGNLASTVTSAAQSPSLTPKPKKTVVKKLRGMFNRTDADDEAALAAAAAAEQQQKQQQQRILEESLLAAQRECERLTAIKTQYENELFGSNVLIQQMKQNLAELGEERDKWQTRCLNQQQRIEQLEAEQRQMQVMLQKNHFVPGGALSRREPSFCPEF